jgi:hypothetical protein
MGSLNNGSPDLAAFTGQVFKKGLDLGRSTIGRDLGVYTADANATIRAGQLVSRNATGAVIAATGADVFGVGKWNKQQFGVSVNVDEAIVLNGTTPTNLRRGNISNVAVRSAPNMGGTLFTGAGGDYNANLTNGTIARDATTTIGDGDTVYVTYTYALTDADFDFDGRVFHNLGSNDVSNQDNRITVITDWSLLFNMEWDTSRTYALTGANSNLFCSTEGKFTNASGTDFVGKVFQLPTAQDQYMGMTVSGIPVEQ